MFKFIENFTTIDIESNSRGRIYYFDNLKFWLIMLVVIGHFINPVSGDNALYKGVYMFIYTFHMPLFIFVTGYFAKSVIDRHTGRFKFEKIIHYLILYLFLSLVIFFINYYLIENTNSYKFFQPINPGWYLMSTIIWYGLIPILNNVKPKYVLIGGIIIALIVGYDPMVLDYLTISRTICFFPFFMAGYYITQDHVESFLKFGGVYIKVAAVIFMIAFLAFCLWDPVNLSAMRKVVSPHYPYCEIKVLGDAYMWLGPIVRLGWYVVAAFVSAAFMLSVSRVQTWYSQLGQRTLQIYIWHAIAVRLLKYAGLYELVNISNEWYVLFLPIALGIILTFVFAFKPLGAPFNWVLKQKFGFLFKDN